MSEDFSLCGVIDCMRVAKLLNAAYIWLTFHGVAGHGDVPEETSSGSLVP